MIASLEANVCAILTITSKSNQSQLCQLVAISSGSYISCQSQLKKLLTAVANFNATTNILPDFRAVATAAPGLTRPEQELSDFHGFVFSTKMPEFLQILQTDGVSCINEATSSSWPRKCVKPLKTRQINCY